MALIELHGHLARGAALLAERLGAAQPIDAAEIDLGSYRGLRPPWNDWPHVAARGRAWSRGLADLLLQGKEGGA